MKKRLLLFVLLALVVLVAVAGSCARWLADDGPARIWTPAPVRGAPLEATRSSEILPTLAPVTPAWTAQPAPAQPIRPGAALSPTPELAPNPSPDPNLVIVTEGDVLQAIATGMAGQGGASLEGVSVRFADGKFVFSAAKLAYGAIEVNNLLLVGRLAAVEGQLRLETESIAPRGLVTSLIPTFANQALAQYTSQWYVEEARVADGRLELQIR